MHLKSLENKNKPNPKSSSLERSNKDQSNETNICFFKKINKMEKPIAMLNTGKKQKIQNHRFGHVIRHYEKKQQ
jgi:hypothetical protein